MKTKTFLKLFLKQKKTVPKPKMVIQIEQIASIFTKRATVQILVLP